MSDTKSITAEEYLKEKYEGIYKAEGFEKVWINVCSDSIKMLMQDFANLKMKEQRENCSEALENSMDWDNAEKGFMLRSCKAVEESEIPEV